MSQRHVLIANVHFAPFSYGGATIVAEEIAHALMRRGGYVVSVVSTCVRPDLAPYGVVRAEKAGITNYLINLPEHRSYAERYDNPAVTARLAELVSALHPDLIHAHCLQDIGTGIFPAAEAACIPVVLSVHDFWWLCERQFMVRIDQTYCGQNPVQVEACKGCAENYWAAKMRFDHMRDLASRAARVTYPSNFAKDLHERSGFAPGKGVVWENGVHLPEAGFFEDQKARQDGDATVTFGYLGGPSQIKGWPLIRDAFATLGRDDFRVLLVEGSLDGSWWKGQNFADLMGDWRVVPRFSQLELDRFYAQIDVLLFPSQWKETYGLALREALARGLPVIQTDSGGTVEHDAVVEQDLIPIGPYPQLLCQQIEKRLDQGQVRNNPVPVQSFAAQADAFHVLVEQIIG